MERIPTHIYGLDDLIQGGFPKGNTILVSGPAGTGKTVFSLQYLCKGAEKGEKCVFISFEMMPEQLLEQSEQFGWKLRDYVEQGNVILRYYDLNAIHVSTVLKDLQTILKRYNPTRLVIDSLTILGVYAELVETSEIIEMLNMNDKISIPTEAVTRRTITNLIHMLDVHPVTSIVTSELGEGSKWLSRDTISEFICDGVVLLKNEPTGRSLSRTIEVRKMRLTNIRGGIYGFTFSQNGITVNI
ncbi:AAA family ATPase [Candidatus Micrarchaeota archaeon]|nr:AAA family ATPase [Candidatus Micrarchaeota archaeon]